MLGLCLVVDACIVAPTVGGEDEGCDEVEFAIRGSALGIVGAIRLTTPGKVALAVAVLMLHVLLAPAPQTVEDVLLTKLYGNHQTIRHALSTGIVVLYIRYVAHRVAHLEVDLVGASEHIVEHFLQLCVDVSLVVAHLHKEVTVLVGFKCAFLPRRQGHRLDGEHQQRCQNS